MKSFRLVAVVVFLVPLLLFSFYLYDQLSADEMRIHQMQIEKERGEMTEAQIHENLTFLKNRNIQRSKLQIIQIMYLLVLMVGLFYYYYISRMEQKEADNQAREYRKLVQKTIAKHDRQIHSLALDLHDDIAQNLFVALTSLQKDPATSSQLIRDTLTKIRSISSDLRPGEAVTLPIKFSLQKLCESIASLAPFQVEYSCSGTDQMQINTETRIQIYRIIQESLMNALKHSKASRVSVKVLSSYPHLTIRVEDNGIGFDAAQTDQSFGLNSLKERTEMIGGTFSLQTAPGEGTKISIELTPETS